MSGVDEVAQGLFENESEYENDFVGNAERQMESRASTAPTGGVKSAALRSGLLG